MIVKGRVEETIIISKEVEVEVPDGASDDAVEMALRDKAYEKIITDQDSGWELIDSLEVDVQTSSWPRL